MVVLKTFGNVITDVSERFLSKRLGIEEALGEIFVALRNALDDPSSFTNLESLLNSFVFLSTSISLHNYPVLLQYSLFKSIAKLEPSQQILKYRDVERTINDLRRYLSFQNEHAQALACSILIYLAKLLSIEKKHFSTQITIIEKNILATFYTGISAKQSLLPLVCLSATSSLLQSCLTSFRNSGIVPQDKEWIQYGINEWCSLIVQIQIPVEIQFVAIEALVSVLCQPNSWDLLEPKQKQTLLKLVLQIGENCRGDITYCSSCALILSIIDVNEIFEYIISLPNYVTELLKQQVTLLCTVESLSVRWKTLKILAKFVMYPDWKLSNSTVNWPSVLDKGCQSEQQLQYLSSIVSDSYQSYVSFFNLTNPRQLELPV